MKRSLWIGLLLGALLAACTTACSRVTPDNYAKVRAGMTREEVHALLGKPDEVSGSGFGNLTLSAETWRGSKHTVVISFAGEKVALKTIESTPDD